MRDEYGSLGKKTRKKLRELAGKAHDRELGTHLDELFADFEAYRRGELAPIDLCDRIHAFHQGPARDVYVTHTRLKPDALVARAVAHDVLDESELDEEIRKLLELEEPS